MLNRFSLFLVSFFMAFSTTLLAQELIRGNERNGPYVISTDVGRVDSLINHPDERGSVDVKFLPYQNGTIYVDITVFSKDWSFNGNAASFKIDSVTTTCRCRATGGSNDRDLGNEKFQARSINIDYQIFKKIAEAEEEVVVLYSGYEYRFTDEHLAAVKKLFYEYNNRGSE